MQRVPDRDITEQTVVHYHKLVRLILHIPPLTEHSPRPTVSHPVFEAREEVHGLVEFGLKTN